VLVSPHTCCREISVMYFASSSYSSNQFGRPIEITLFDQWGLTSFAVRTVWN